MSLTWVTAAAANNAAWCDAVCRSHGHPGEFSSMLWWIGLRLAEPVASTARWATVRDETLLARWEAAWRGPSGERPQEPPQVLFRPALLEDPNVRFLAAYHEEALVAGAIVYRAAGVVSLSNTFFTEAAPEALRAELLTQATAALPGLPLVGYEHGSELSTWLSHGFESMGPLRVWAKRSSEDCGSEGAR